MKVLIAERTDIFHDSRVLKEAKSLSDQGYAVTVYGFRSKLKLDKQNKYNFKIITFPLISRKFRALRNISILIYIIIINFIIGLKKAKYYHSHNTMFLVGMYLSSKIHRGKFIYDSHEVQWECTKADEILERMFIRKADAIICVSEGIAEEVSRRYSISIENIVVISNYPYFSQYEVDLNQNIDSNNIKFIFSGGLSFENIENFLRAIKNINKLTVYLQIYHRGSCYEKINSLISELNIGNKIEFLPIVTPEKINEIISKYDVAFNLPSNPHNKVAYRYSSSNKMYQYLSAGLPVLCSQLEIYQKDFVENNVGISVNARDIESIRNGINKFIENPNMIIDMRKKAIELSKSIFNWITQEKKLLDIYKRLS